MLECQKDNCRQRYVGYSERNFRERLYEHLGYVRNKVLSKATGTHFNLPGHRMADMKFTLVEKVKSKDPLYGREREKFHIKKFNTFYGGINRTK